jgi:hypothetical protein
MIENDDSKKIISLPLALMKQATLGVIEMSYVFRSISKENNKAIE